MVAGYVDGGDRGQEGDYVCGVLVAGFIREEGSGWVVGVCCKKVPLGPVVVGDGDSSGAVQGGLHDGGLGAVAVWALPADPSLTGGGVEGEERATL